MFFLIIFHVFITVAMITVILLQKGETGGLMSSYNTGLFTAKGSANFLTRITAILATIFILNCIAMTILSSQQARKTQAIIRQFEKSKNE